MEHRKSQRWHKNYEPDSDEPNSDEPDSDAESEGLQLYDPYMGRISIHFLQATSAS